MRAATKFGKPSARANPCSTDPRNQLTSGSPSRWSYSVEPPEGINLAEGSHLTPVPIDEAAASLSAILLDDAYYDFIVAGRKEVDGLPRIGEDRLIPLKASAWLDLSERYARGEQIDSKTIRKHANDVLRLSQLLAPDIRIPLAAKIARDLDRFLDGIVLDRSIDPKAIKINNSVVEIVERVRRAYELHQRQ